MSYLVQDGVINGEGLGECDHASVFIDAEQLDSSTISHNVILDGTLQHNHFVNSVSKSVCAPGNALSAQLFGCIIFKLICLPACKLFRSPLSCLSFYPLSVSPSSPYPLTSLLFSPLTPSFTSPFASLLCPHFPTSFSLPTHTPALPPTISPYIPSLPPHFLSFPPSLPLYLLPPQPFSVRG